jgi:hypothetical protein
MHQTAVAVNEALAKAEIDIALLPIKFVLL